MRPRQRFELADQAYADAQLLLLRRRSPTVFRNVGGDGANTERQMLIQIPEKFAMAECHRQHAASVRSPDFQSVRIAATARFLPALLPFAMRCGRPAPRANAAVLRSVARREFASAP